MTTASLTNDTYFQEITDLATDDRVLVYDNSGDLTVTAAQEDIIFAAGGVQANLNMLDSTLYKFEPGFNIITADNARAGPFDIDSVAVGQDDGIFVSNRRVDAITVSGAFSGDDTIAAGGWAWFVYHGTTLYRLA